jgi:S-adenosylhomocysteine hydrolase
MIKDNTTPKWTTDLKNDIQRINKTINAIRIQVDDGIDRLRLLEKERNNILMKCLGECDE